MRSEKKKNPSRRRELIHLLHNLQEEYGYIPPHAVKTIARQLKMSPSEVFGVLTFYNAFSLSPLGKHRITVCMGTACHVRGAPAILEEFERRLGISAGETSQDGMFSLETVNCVGACALGPIAIADGEYKGQMKTRDVEPLIAKIKSEE